MRRSPLFKASLALACLGVSLAAGARDLVWTGQQSGTWNATDLNWKDEGGNAVAWQNGDNVTFTDVGAANTTVRMNVSPTAGKVVYDIANSFELWFSPGNFKKGVESIVKRGAGVMWFGNTDNGGCPSDFNGVLEVAEGRLEFSCANCYTSFGGTYDVVIRDGAELRVLSRNSIGKIDTSNGSGASVTVEKGGVFSLYGEPGGNHVANSLRNLSLQGGTLDLHAKGGDERIGVISVTDTATFAGDTPYTLNSNGSFANQHWTLFWDHPTTFDVADITGDDRTDLLFGLTFARCDSPAAGTWDTYRPDLPRSIVKTGKGRMTISQFASSSHSVNGSITVKEGVLEYNGQGSFCGDHPVAISVSTNATLLYSMRNVVNGYYLTNKCQMTVSVDHGSFIIDDPSGTGGHNYVGRELILDNAVFENRMEGYNDNNTSVGLMTFGSLVWFKGETPYELLPSANCKKPRVHFNDEPLTELRVEEITGDDRTDVTLGYKFADCFTAATADKAYSLTPGGFVKTGAGTLCLVNPNSVFTGDVEIREGKVYLDRGDNSFSRCGTANRSFLGDCTKKGRTITVCAGAELSTGLRNPLDAYQPGFDHGGNDIESTFVLQGTLSGAFTDTYPINFGHLTIDGGAFGVTNCENPYGPVSVRGICKITGTRPFEPPMPAKLNCARWTVYDGRSTTFEIDDVTGDGAPDFTLPYQLSQPPDNSRTNYTYGFTKTGLGTMRLASAAIRDAAYRINGEAVVEGGTLLVDDETLMNLSGLAVSAGAMIGGTGTVQNVTLAAGAGFAATAGQKNELRVSGDLTLPETGIVEIYNPNGLPVNGVGARVARISGTFTKPADLSGWRVTVNGQLTSLPVYVSGNVLRAGARPGLALIVR